MRDHLATLLLVAALLLAVALADLLFVSAPLPLAVLYAIPILIAAQCLSSRITLVVATAALLLYLVGLVADRTSWLLAGLDWLTLLVVAYLGYLLAARIEDTERARASLQVFLGMVAHDLRGPLTSLLGYAQLLARPQTSPPVREQAIHTLQAEARRLNRLASDLIDAAQAGLSRFQIQPQPMDLVVLVDRVAARYQTASPNHQIIVEAPEHLEGEWDPDRLAQVLDNLIGNAIKYSPQGGPILIQVERRDEQAKVTVTDQGLGMRPEEIHRLFEPFSRLQTGQLVPGVGLGLYITSLIVHAHGGRIWATSAGPGKGSSFTILLPLRARHNEPDALPRAEAS